jgi:hypothetical protein
LRPSKPPDEEPLIGRTPFVEGNHQRKVGWWYWLPSWSTGAKIVDHFSAGIAPVSWNRLPNRTWIPERPDLPCRSKGDTPLLQRASVVKLEARWRGRYLLSDGAGWTSFRASAMHPEENAIASRECQPRDAVRGLQASGIHRVTGIVKANKYRPFSASNLA